MASTSRKARKRTINYQEVDSDQDIDSEDQDESGEIKSMGSLGVIKRTVGDTYGTKEATKRSKKRSRKSKKATEEENKVESMYDSKLLLRMPFDIFAETCSHLEGVDLINLAQVNKSFRRTLLSKAARSIWASRRKRDGYPLPDDMTELELATLIYGRHCQECGSKLDHHDDTLSFHLRQRSCKKCRRNLLIREKALKKSWPALHPAAVCCVSYKTSSYSYSNAETYRSYSIADLVTVDKELKELEEEDEVLLSKIETLKYRSGTRSRHKEAELAPVADRVSSYLELRASWVKRREMTSEELITGAKKSEEVRRQLAGAEFEKLKKKSIDTCEYLKNNAGWSEAEVQRLYNDRYGLLIEFQHSERIPKMSPFSDPEAWAAYRSFVSKTISDENEHMARIDRWHRVYHHYLQLVGDYRLSLIITIFPESCSFVGLPAIIPLWKPVDADTSAQALTKAYPIFRQALLQYQVDVRIKAIRTIIAANREVKLSSLSKDASFYPETIYDSAFFALATSQFVYWENRSVKVSAFPEIVQGETRRSTDSLRTDLQQVRVIRSMLVQARLDTSNATWQDLAQLGKCFVWINSPFKGKRRKVLYDCIGLLDIVIRRGPSLPKIKAGEVVEIGFKQDESDEEGPASDDGSEDERSDDEEEHEEDEESD